MTKPNLKYVPKEIEQYIEFLEEELEKFLSSPYLDSYRACMNTIQSWNRQLTAQEIDIFNVEDKPKFEMAHKYLTEQKPYIEQLEYLRSLMNPMQQREIMKNIENKKLGIAEKIALKNGNAKI